MAAALLVSAAGSACTDAGRLPTEAAESTTLSSLQYNSADAPARSFDEGGNWQAMSTDALWAAIEKSGREAHVGLKSPDRRRGMYQGRRLLTDDQQARGQAAVLAIAGVKMGARHDRYPVLRVELADRATLEQIRRLPFVDYVEPARLPQEPGFAAESLHLMDSGCAYPAWASGTHYYLNSELVPHRFGLMGVENAWRRSRGRGVVVGVVDTGLDLFQGEQWGSFSSGQSTGRTVRIHSTFGGSVDGPCSHGPRMAGLITAPRNGTSTIGVAHEADLIAVRFTDGIVDVDAWHAAAAIDYVGVGHYDLSFRRVIPMSWRSAPSGYLNDAIDWHYANGVLFTGAVGQSDCLNPFRGVAWPARKDNVIAVAGVEDNNELPCRMHRGPETDMAALMDYPVPGEYSGQLAEIKESSSANAMVASTAALIWARYPTWTRNQVVARIHQSGYYYPYREERRGYGIVNVYKAVGGFQSLHLGAPVYGEPWGTYTATAYPTGDGPFTYLWSNGATTASTTYPSGPYGQVNNIWVTVTDQVEGISRTDTETVHSGYDTSPPPTCDPNLDPTCPS